MSNTPNTKRVQILLAEDNQTDAAFTIMALSQAGYTESVRWVKDGKEAMNWLFAEGSCAGQAALETFNLVLLDVQMPRYNGLEVLARMRSDPYTRKIPAVIWSGMMEPSIMTKAYALGATECVQKPMGLAEYLVLVKRIAKHWAGPPDEAP